MLKESDDFDIFGATFDSNMTFEKHLSGFRAASQRFRILFKSFRVFHDILIFRRCFQSFVLPVLDYCSPVCCSVGDTHLNKTLSLADVIIGNIQILPIGGRC